MRRSARRFTARIRMAAVVGAALAAALAGVVAGPARAASVTPGAVATRPFGQNLKA